MVENLLSEKFGISGAAVEPLTGYDNLNFLIRTGSGEFVLKTYPSRPGLMERLSAESVLLKILAGKISKPIPKPVGASGGDDVIEAEMGGRILFARLLTFVEGDLAGPNGLTSDLLSPLGRTLAEIALALDGVRLAGIEARRSPWDLQHYYLNKDSIGYIVEAADRKCVEYFFRKADEFVRPRLESLPRGIIHGDPNEWNVLTTDSGVTLVDFGDACYSPLVNDVAIAGAYAAMFSEAPVTSVVPLIEGYCAVRKLSEAECDLLFDLIALRLCVSVCNSAKARVEMPDNTYALLSEEKAWKTLRRWVAINPLFAAGVFREAAGLAPPDHGEALEELATRRRNTSTALSLQFDEPIRMRSAAFQYMFDEDGNSYLDCYNNIPHVGHCHPRVAEAVAKGSITLNTNSRYLTEEFNVYTERLLSKFPNPLEKVFLVNSGSAATDLALRLASAHTGRHAYIVAEHGYHGNTRSGIGVSHYKYAGKGGAGRPDDVLEAPIPDLLGERSSPRDHFAELEARIADAGFAPAAFIAEPIVGCGGQVPLPEGYLRKVYPLVRSLGGVCISDEVQTGFGRLGRWFWGFEMHGVVPDIVVLGKPIANGHPMAAVVTTAEVAASFETGMEFFSSFGGNTVSCRAGLAVLDVLDDEKLDQNAEEVGSYLLDGLKALTERFECCADARGAGLFLGLELIDAVGEQPDTAFASRVKNRLKERMILVGTDGPHDNVIKIKPPVCFTKPNADQLLTALEEAIRGG